MRFGSWGAKLSPAGVATLLEGALDAGIDTLDLADIYGDHTTNPLVGDALALRPGLRQRLRLLAKVGIVKTDSPGNPRGVQHYDLSVRHLRAALDTSLRDLRTDHVDVLMLHRFDPLLEPAAHRLKGIAARYPAAVIDDQRKAAVIGDALGDGGHDGGG